MRLLITIISFIISLSCFPQIKPTIQAARADSGKYEFKQQAQSENQDYSSAYRILTNQVKLNPRNAELRYFLGYAIDRINANYGDDMVGIKKEMTIKASEQFEEVNRLEPNYKGEIVILDPYAKLTAIWGSLAEAYLNRKLIDSATWAFLEGRKRGGFTDPFLQFNRQLLNSCNKNSILITYGDNITIPIWYLQTIENYRPDITIVDANLIHTGWYTKYLKTEKKLKISFSDALIDTINYLQWESKTVEIVNPNDTAQKFTWELRPTYLDSFILKGDRILLEIFRQNYFSRPIYFTANSDSSYNLFLTPYLIDEGLVHRVSGKIFDYKEDLVIISNNLNSYNIQNIKKGDILKSRDAIFLLNNFRWAYFSNISRLVTQSNYDKARELIKQMGVKFSREQLPFTSQEVEKYFVDFFQPVDKNYH